jgi:hypothetical protein
MRIIILSVFALGVAVNAASADDWAGQPLATNLGTSQECGATTCINLYSVPSGDVTFAGLRYLRHSNDPASIPVVDGQLYIPLSDFATSSSVQTLQASFSQLAQSLHAQTRISNSGIAQALAMAGVADLQSDEKFAVSMNVGFFRGQTALAGGATARLRDHVSINGGVTTGVNGGQVGARAGIRFGW